MTRECNDLTILKLTLANAWNKEKCSWGTKGRFSGESVATLFSDCTLKGKENKVFCLKIREISFEVRGSLFTAYVHPLLVVPILWHIYVGIYIIMFQVIRIFSSSKNIKNICNLVFKKKFYNTFPGGHLYAKHFDKFLELFLLWNFFWIFFFDFFWIFLGEFFWFFFEVCKK